MPAPVAEPSKGATESPIGPSSPAPPFHVVISSARGVAAAEGDAVTLHPLVVAIAAEDLVVPAARGVPREGARVAGQVVRAVAAEEPIVTAADSVPAFCEDVADDKIIADAAVHLVVAQPADEFVTPGKAADEVVAALTVDGVVSGGADDHVGPAVPVIMPEPVIVAGLPKQRG